MAEALPGLDGATIAEALHKTSKSNKWDDQVAEAASFNGGRYDYTPLLIVP